jgi:hypothetical protein
MILDLSLEFDLKKFNSYCDKLITNKSKVNIKKVQNKMTISQNSYLHVCICFFCLETGYTKEEGKIVLKREFGSFMVYEKQGRKFLRSSSDLDTLEVTEFIEWIRNLCYENFDCYVPTPQEYIQNQFEINKQLQNVK